MFSDVFDKVAETAASKAAYLKDNVSGYFILSMLAGMFIGFGVLLTNSIGGQLQGAQYTKIILGVSFAVALSLVIMAGAELFTGNTLVMFAGFLKRKVTLSDAVKLWTVCWIGNLAGSVVLGFLFTGTGLADGAVLDFMISGTAAKTGASAMALFTRGILCNILVCLAVWCATKLKSESAKLIMTFWCLYAFITSGFEHSIANMTLFAATLMNSSEVAAGACAYNLVLVTLGNMVGGILFVAVPYYLAAGNKNK